MSSFRRWRDRSAHYSPKTTSSFSKNQRGKRMCWMTSLLSLWIPSGMSRTFTCIKWWMIVSRTTWSPGFLLLLVYKLLTSISSVGLRRTRLLEPMRELWASGMTLIRKDYVNSVDTRFPKWWAFLTVTVERCVLLQKPWKTNQKLTL